MVTYQMLYSNTVQIVLFVFGGFFFILLVFFYFGFKENVEFITFEKIFKYKLSTKRDVYETLMSLLLGNLCEENK